MIERFRDHAANERTFLAWIRTAVAIMALGFLVERFDLVVGRDEPIGDGTARAVGMALVVVGILMIGGAAARFYLTKRAIEAAGSHSYHGTMASVVLAGLMTLVGVFGLAYLFQRVVA